MSTLIRQPDYDVHPLAAKTLDELEEGFAEELFFKAQNVANLERAGVVTDKHVQIAHDRVRLNRRAKRRGDGAKVVGRALFGAFLGGFITALGAGDQIQVVFFTINGIVGLALIFWGFLDG